MITPKPRTPDLFYDRLLKLMKCDAFELLAIIDAKLAESAAARKG